MWVTSITNVLSFLTIWTLAGGYKFGIMRKGAGSLGWTKDPFWRSECKDEHQPVVEYYYLNGMQYLFFSQRVTWEEAGMLCKNYNARLAILDKKEKAKSVAEAIADSNIVMEDTWLGGRRSRRTWLWIVDESGSRRNLEISQEPDIDDFPPWSRRPSRTSKECLAIDRRAHSHPNFIDLDCRLQRPFICEKKPEEAVKNPVPSKWVRINRNTFTLYHARVSWQEAVLYCRSVGARLAILKNPSIVEILANAMTKTRPDFETVWIGAHYSNDEWVWISTGAALSEVKDENGYPPWHSEKPDVSKGCVLLDRHIENSGTFVETTCDRKRDFVCEEYPEDEEDEWLNEPIQFLHEDSIYVVYPLEKSWEESRAFCLERGSVLAYVDDINATNLIVEAMGDHPKEISHSWIGGVQHHKSNDWQWVHDGRKIAPRKDTNGFPPWANINERLDYYADSSKCLNLDRSDHVKPHLYGLDCANRQPFVCKITCDVAPPVQRGNWACKKTSKGKNCWVQCDKGFIPMGVRNVSCSYQSGWITSRNWLEVPLCLQTRNYGKRMIRSLSNELQNSAGYYVILDHGNEKMRSLSMAFVERIVNAFPVSNQLKMGMSCLVTNPPIHLPFNQTDTCFILDALRGMSRRLTRKNEQLEVNTDILYEDLWAYRGRKTLIFTIVDSQRGEQYVDLVNRMKMVGQRIIIIGLEEDWKFLSPLASFSDDRRRFIYLFNSKEFSQIIDELRKARKKTVRCSSQTGNISRQNQKSGLPENAEVAFRIFETGNLTLSNDKIQTIGSNATSMLKLNDTTVVTKLIIETSKKNSTTPVSAIQSNGSRTAVVGKDSSKTVEAKPFDDLSMVYMSEAKRNSSKGAKKMTTNNKANSTSIVETNVSKTVPTLYSPAFDADAIKKITVSPPNITDSIKSAKAKNVSKIVESARDNMKNISLMATNFTQ